MPQTAEDLMEWVSHFPVPELDGPLTPGDVAQIVAVLQQANMFRGMTVQLFAAMFGVPDQTNPYGPLVDQGTMRLAARYLQQSRFAWHMSSCEGRLHWGWWLCPFHLTSGMATTAPTHLDHLYFPCVYFFMGGRWWMICLHLLWYLCSAWQTHFSRLYAWDGVAVS